MKSEATGAPVEQAGQLRIPQAVDGHFYIEATINGRPVRFLVDSGATMTTIGRRTAARTQVVVSDRRNQMVRTGNGIVRVATGRAASFDIGAPAPQCRTARGGRGRFQCARDELPVVA